MTTRGRATAKLEFEACQVGLPKHTRAKGTSDWATNEQQDPRRHRDLRQGLGHGTADRLQPRVAARRCLGHSDTVVPAHGDRVIAHDRRGHGRSMQTGDGLGHYADDLAAVPDHPDPHDAVPIPHSPRGGEVAKAVLVSAVPPLMVQPTRIPGTAHEVLDDKKHTSQRTAPSSNGRWHRAPSTASTDPARNLLRRASRTGGPDGRRPSALRRHFASPSPSSPMTWQHLGADAGHARRRPDRASCRLFAAVWSAVEEREAEYVPPAAPRNETLGAGANGLKRDRRRPTLVKERWVPLVMRRSSVRFRQAAHWWRGGGNGRHNGSREPS